MSSTTTVSSNFFNCSSIAASKAVPVSHQIHHPLPCFSVCPIVPPAPSSPFPEAPPLIVQEPSILGKIANLFGIVWDEPPHLMSLKEALDQNKPSFVAYWLQKNDQELANHIDEYRSLLYGLYSTIACDLKEIAKLAENGNIPLVLMYLDRVNQLEMGIEWAARKVFEAAVRGGQLDLILAVLRKGYPVDSTKTFLFEEAAKHRPEIALVLAGENMPEVALLAGMKAAVENDRFDLIRQILNVSGSSALINEAALHAARMNKDKTLKFLIEQGLTEKTVKEALFFACDSSCTQTAHLLASLGSFYLEDPFMVSKLLETGFFPTEFCVSMTKGVSSRETSSLLQAYLKLGKISDQDLIRSWPKNSSDRFAVFRGCLVDRSPISPELESFLLEELQNFAANEQELALRIVVKKGLPNSLIQRFFDKSALTEVTKTSLKNLQDERTRHLESLARLRQGMIDNVVLPREVWDEEAIRKAIEKNGPDILDWTEQKSDPRFRYFGSNDVIGQIEALPNVVLKYFMDARGLSQADDRLKLIYRAQDACKRKGLTHLRVPNAFRVHELKDKDGKTVPVQLVVEELLPIAGHSFNEVKDLLEGLNQDPKTLKIVNGYFSELTSLVCETGLTDLKPTNTPLLKDGSGLAIVDSDMQNSSPESSLYNFLQEDHSLIDWLEPQNFEAVGQVLENDPACPKGIDRKVYEKTREKQLQLQQEIRRFHLFEYGGDLSAPITLTAQEIEKIDPDTRELCLNVVGMINQRMPGDRRKVVVSGDDWVSAASTRAPHHYVRHVPDETRMKVVWELKKLGKIKSFSNLGNVYGIHFQA